MAVDVFLKLGDIKGESTDAKHAGEIDVLSWSWGISQTGTAAPGGGGGAGKVSFNDLTFTHNVDKASPMLMKACATGQHVKEATLVARKAGKGQQEYLVIKMTDVLVTGVQPSSAHEQPMENVSSLCSLASAASATMAEESVPPERKKPTGTSETRRSRTESFRISRASSTIALSSARSSAGCGGDQ